MTASLASGIITQSGNDSVSSLGGNGASSTAKGLITTYDMTTNSLVINGTLTIDTTIQKLISSVGTSKITINAGGELIVTGQKTTAGNAPYPCIGLEHYSSTSSDTSGASCFNLVSTNSSSPAKLTLIDSAILVTGSGGYLLVAKNNFAEIKTQGDRCWILNASGTGTSQGRLRCIGQNSINFTANKTYVGVWLNVGYLQTSLKGFTPINVDGPEINAGMDGMTSASMLTIEDYDTTYIVGNYYSGTHITLFGGHYCRLRNNLVGTNITINSQSATSYDSTAFNIIDFTKIIDPTIQDTIGNKINNASIFIKPIGTLPAAVHPRSGTNTAYSLNTLSGTTGAKGKLSSPLEFLFAQLQTQSSGSLTSYNYFCSTTTRGAEAHTYSVTAYGYANQLVPVSLIGNGSQTPTNSLSKLPTVSTQAVAASLTGISFTLNGTTSVSVGVTVPSTAQQIYDYWVYWSGLVSQYGIDQTLITISNSGNLNITGTITTSAVIDLGGNVTNGIVCTGTASTTGSGKYNQMFLQDSAGNTKKFTGVSDSYLEIKDNLGNTVVAFAQQTSDVWIKTTTGRTYTVKVRKLGYSTFSQTGIDASAGTISVSLQRDKILWPLDSTKTVADLRTEADLLTGYTLAVNGVLTLKANGNLVDAYLSYSRQVETDSTKTLPTYTGSVLSGTSSASTPSGKLSGSGTLSLVGSWTGDQGTVLIQDSSGKSPKLKISGLSDSSVGVLDNSGSLVHFEPISGTNQTFDFNTSSGNTGTWTYIVTSYGNKIIKGTFTPATGQIFTASVSYIPDTGVAGTKAVTVALTNLSLDQKIYDYLSYWHTTQAGIIVDPFATISPAGLDVGSYNVIQDSSATSNIAVSGSNLTIKASNMSGTALYSTGTFTSSSGTIDNSYKIRCNNLDSELVLTNISRLRIYPTIEDRDTGQNLAITITTPVYRFKYGNTINNVNLANTLLTKVTSGSTIDNDQQIKKGENIFSLDNTALLLLIKDKTDKIQVTNGRVEASINTVPTQDETFIIESPSTIASISALDKPEWYFYARDSSGQFFNPGSQSFIANMYRGNSVLQLDLNVTYDTNEKYSKITLNTTNSITEYKIGDTIKLYCSVLINGVTKQSPIAQSTVVAGNVQEVLTLAQIENSTKLAMKAHVETLNNGVKNASLLIPHTENLT